MRFRSSILTILLIAGFSASEAGATLVDTGKNDFTFKVCGRTFGLADWQNGLSIVYGVDRKWTTLYLGPFESIDVPFTAVQGLIAFCSFIAIAIVLAVGLVIMLAARWRKRSTCGPE